MFLCIIYCVLYFTRQTITQSVFPLCKATWNLIKQTTQTHEKNYFMLIARNKNLQGSSVIFGKPWRGAFGFFQIINEQ